MKHAILGAALAAALSLGSGTTRAESIDFGSISCNDFVQTVADSSEDDIAAIMLWLDGYLSGVSGDTELDFAGLGEFGENLVARCNRNPREQLLRAARAVGLE